MLCAVLLELNLVLRAEFDRKLSGKKCLLANWILYEVANSDRCINWHTGYTKSVSKDRFLVPTHTDEFVTLYNFYALHVFWCFCSHLIVLIFLSNNEFVSLYVFSHIQGHLFIFTALIFNMN